MNKQEFLNELRSNLRKFGENEINGVISYYDELISDRVENSTPEETAVADLGNIKNISAQISAELVSARLSAGNNGGNIKNTGSSFLIILMLCASPILLPVGIAFFAVFFSLIAAAFSVIVSLFAVSASFIIAVIPFSIKAFANAGTGGVLALSGLMLAGAAICGAAGAAAARYSIKIINLTIMGFAKLVKKIIKRN